MHESARILTLEKEKERVEKAEKERRKKTVQGAQIDGKGDSPASLLPILALHASQRNTLVPFPASLLAVLLPVWHGATPRPSGGADVLLCAW